jgi:hypothetical protein
VENTPSFPKSGQRSQRRVWIQKGLRICALLKCGCSLGGTFFSNSVMFSPVVSVVSFIPFERQRELIREPEVKS